jgi:hypothetical protein
MAVLVEFDVLNATPEQMYELEERTRQRGEALGRPPFVGCMFLAVTPRGSTFHFVSAWRSEEAFRTALDTMLDPDLTAVGASVSNVLIGPVMSMAIPGHDAP